MRILFVAALHHPAELEAAIRATPPGERPPLFPPSMSQHFWAKALQKRGHTLDVFYRNLPLFGKAKPDRFQQGLTPGKVASALLRHFPVKLNLDYRVRNRRLVEKALAFKPDILWMAGDNTLIYVETLAEIKRLTGCRIVYACGTSPIVFSHPIDRAAARLYDLVLANDYYHGIQWLELGAKKMECLPLSACDPDFHYAYPLTESEAEQYKCDIAFVGTLVPSSLYSRRVKAIEALRDFDLGIWSIHEVPESLRRFERGKALGETTQHILSAAKINLNTHGDFVYYGGNLRLFEIAGAGVFQITDDLPGVRQWFSDGENIVTYQSLDNLREKVAYYLSHDQERETIARQGQEHVYRFHTYDCRVARFEELVTDGTKFC